MTRKKVKGRGNQKEKGSCGKWAMPACAYGRLFSHQAKPLYPTLIVGGFSAVKATNPRGIDPGNNLSNPKGT